MSDRAPDTFNDLWSPMIGGAILLAFGIGVVVLSDNEWLALAGWIAAAIGGTLASAMTVGFGVLTALRIRDAEQTAE